MYEEFYGLSERPFSKTPDPRFLYLSRSHQEALARLLFAVEERDPVLLTGEIGCGKTTLSRAMTDQLDDSYRVLFLVNPRLNPGEFLRLVALRLGVAEPAPNRVDLLEQIGAELYRYFEKGLCPVLIIDEAQLIPYRETFDEIRLLTNLQLDDCNLLSLVIMGQPELRRRLAHRSYEPLRQRLGMQFHLQPLSLDETGGYLEHRINTCGGPQGLFLPEAVEHIHQYSRGIPRKINQVASLALLEGFGQEAAKIGVEIVAAVLPELEL